MLHKSLATSGSLLLVADRRYDLSSGRSVGVRLGSPKNSTYVRTRGRASAAAKCNRLTAASRQVPSPVGYQVQHRCWRACNHRAIRLGQQVASVGEPCGIEHRQACRRCAEPSCRTSEVRRRRENGHLDWRTPLESATIAGARGER
jgi:hypothetical protein